MPNINLIPQVLYSPLDPYHFVFDNLPLINILERISQVNSQVDIDADALRQSVGTQGTLANRLSKSINPDGTIQTAAIDSTSHNIGAHTDGVYQGVSYVRMKQSESAKLSLVADGATSLAVEVNTGNSNPSVFSSGTVEIIGSPGISWAVTSGNQIQANLNLPTTGLHRGYYDQNPAPASHPPNYKNYLVTTTSTIYKDGTLRVYVNGIRLSESALILVPTGVSASVLELTYTSNAATGSFTLSDPINSEDIIRVDFDVLYL